MGINSRRGPCSKTNPFPTSHYGLTKSTTQVQPLISKFEEATCLKKITVMGVKHEQTLGKLRSGLAQGGRTFIAGHTQ